MGITPRTMRMRVTLSSELANTLLLPVLSPVLKMPETWGVTLILTMDYTTFGKFMAQVAEVDAGQKIGAFSIQEVDIFKEPRNLTFNNGVLYRGDQL